MVVRKKHYFDHLQSDVRLVNCDNYNLADRSPISKRASDKHVTGSSNQ